MKKFTIDLEFDEVTGDSRILVDFNDDSMTALEINESIQSGELLEEVVEQAGEVLGENIARQIREGRLKALCLDNHPELKNIEQGILINSSQNTKQEIEQ
ncbi:MAG: hypothetical protein ACQETH_10710 [Candidatus Rifleibacteriota bacterium]